MSEEREEIFGMYEVLDALVDLIEHANPEKREALANALDGYREDYPEDFYWAVGAQSPMLLGHLMMSIDMACRGEGETKSRLIRLVDRKPEGNA